MSAGPALGIFKLLAIAPRAFVAVDAALDQHAERSLDALRREVIRWRDEHHCELSEADCERLAHWLNRNFYRL